MPKKTPGVSPWDEFGMNDNKYHNSSETPSVSSGSFIGAIDAPHRCNQTESLDLKKLC